MPAFQAAGAAKTYQNIEYSHPGTYSLRLDAQIPDGPGPFPAAIIVHGGAWVTGDRRLSVQPLFSPLLDTGFAWFSISYRLANALDLGSLSNGVAAAASLGTATDDVRSAISYVRAHAAEYHVDPNRIGLIGESAGAQLASMAALKPGPDDDAVQAVVAMYSPSDLVKLIQTSPQFPDSIRQALQRTPFGQLLFSALRNLSPVNWVRKDAPPFLFIHGTQDRVVPFSQSVEMCDALRKTGASCDVYPVTGGGHGLRWWEAKAGETAYKPYLTEWLMEKLAPSVAKRK